MSSPNTFLEEKPELFEKLTPMEYHVTQEKGTEPPFQSEFFNFFEDGNYFCKICDNFLFRSEWKYPCSCGWPAFKQVESGSVKEIVDHSLNRTRKEIVCSKV